MTWQRWIGCIRSLIMVESSFVLYIYWEEPIVSRNPIFEEEKIVVFLVINIALASSIFY